MSIRTCCIIGLLMMTGIFGDIQVSAAVWNDEDVARGLVEKIREDRSLSQDEWRQLLSLDPYLVLDMLQPLTQSATLAIRWNAYRHEMAIAIHSDDLRVRQTIVEHLLVGAHDPTPEVSGDIVRTLSDEIQPHFQERDFTEQAKASLRSLIQKDGLSFGTIAIIGIANMREYIPELERFRETREGWADQLALAWEAQLALARMGSQQDIAVCIARVENTADIVVRVERYFPYLAYIRQPAILPVFQKYLESDERIVPNPENPARRVCVCQYAIAHLSRILSDFPVAPSYGKYSQAEIDTARAWMRAQTEFNIKR